MRGEAGAGRLRHHVGEAIRAGELWHAGDRVAVAVSGGLDSCCLLDLLVATAGWHGGELCVATVDHGTRDGTVDDADFVAELAASHGLTCHRIALGLGPEASEGVAREARFQWLRSLPVDRVALAHQRDDQAETVVLQLLRGAGSAGRAGMAPRRGRWVRPLLDVPRSALEAWAAHRGLTWRDDPSNQDPRYLRNRVRSEVIPLLEAIRPGAVGALARSARHAADDDAWLDEQVAAEPLAAPSDEGWDADWLAGAPAALARRALRRALPGLAAAHLDDALDACRRGAGSVGLPGGRVLGVVDGRLRLDPDER